MPRLSNNKLGSANNTNMAIFRRVGLDLVFVYKLKGWQDSRVIEFFNKIMPNMNDETRFKFKEAIRLISERSQKRANKESDRKAMNPTIK